MSKLPCGREHIHDFPEEAVRFCGTSEGATVFESGFLQEFCERLAGVIVEHGGVLEKIIGDGLIVLVCVFSDSDDVAADATAAARSALVFNAE